MSKSSYLSSCSPPPVGLKGKPICSDVSHNHVDSSANSVLQAIASLTLSIVIIVSLPCLSSNLPAYLEFAVVKIMLIRGCYCFRFVFRPPPFHAEHLPPRQLHLVEVFAKLLDEPAMCALQDRHAFLHSLFTCPQQTPDLCVKATRCRLSVYTRSPNLLNLNFTLLDRPRCRCPAHHNRDEHSSEFFVHFLCPCD